MSVARKNGEREESVKETGQEELQRGRRSATKGSQLREEFQDGASSQL